MRRVLQTMPDERVALRVLVPLTTMDARLAASGLDLSDVGIRARHARLVAVLATPGRCLEEYMRVRGVGDALREGTLSPSQVFASMEDTDEQRRVLLFQHEDEQRALELHLFGSVLSFPPYDPLLVRLSQRGA